MPRRQSGTDKANGALGVAFKLIRILVQDPLNENEWYSITVFKERTEEVIRQLQRLRLGQMSFNFSRRPNGTYEVTGDIPSDDDLRLLYFEFRHLYAKKEPGNFMRVAKIIARRAGNPGVVECMKDLKQQSRSSMVESGFFHDKQGTLSGTKLVDAWFNGKVFHSDRDRRRERNYARLPKNGITKTRLVFSSRFFRGTRLRSSSILARCGPTVE